MKTELGRVAGLLQDRSPPATPLQQRIHRLGIVLVGWFILVIAIIAGLQLARGVSALETLHLSISLAVAAVPEGLPAVLAITLAFGAQRLAHRQALVRQLSSVETLGSVSAICTDKTGTLTRNEMTVREIHTLQDIFDVTGAGYSVEGSILRRPPAHDHRGGLLTEEALQGLTIGCWCNHAQVVPRPHQTGFWEVVGDPTEAALLVAAHKAGVSRSTEVLHVEHEIPFDSQRKAMSVIVSGPMRSRSVFMKGAVEVVLSACTRGLQDGKVGLLTEGQRQQILRANDEMASRALRVLAVAYRDELATHESRDVERDLIFVGLFGMIDPPREEAKAAIATCHQAGIRPIMITGDHPATALAIGRELGLPATKADVMEGRQIDLCSDEHFEDRVARVSIFARVSAEHKLRIIQSLQRQGGVVAMTGDGVNDAPAVKAADIGIAMGNTGTDVTKEAASLVLTNDNFATIVEAVREGRAIYDNILKFIHYLLAGNVGKILFMFVAVLFGLPAPLLAMQILWLNVVTDGLPALALGLDRGEAGVMRRMPRKSNDPLLGVRRGLQVMFHGTLAAGVAFAGFWTVYRGDNENLAEAQLVAFCILGFAQLAYAFTCRSQTETIWQLRPGSNPHLLVATAVSLLLLLAVILIPALRGIFGIEALPLPWEWGFIVVLSLLPALTIESIKGARQLAAKLSERATR
jgi:Ca2+-transporting ATPase